MPVMTARDGGEYDRVFNSRADVIMRRTSAIVAGSTELLFRDGATCRDHVLDRLLRIVAHSNDSSQDEDIRAFSTW